MPSGGQGSPAGGCCLGNMANIGWREMGPGTPSRRDSWGRGSVQDAGCDVFRKRPLTLLIRPGFAPQSGLFYNRRKEQEEIVHSGTCQPRETATNEEEIQIMGVSSSRARVADLAFQVFNRALHPDWFSTRVYRRIPQERWEADVRIIEGGHAVIFGTGSIRLTEVLAGPETTLPEPGLVFHSGIRSERSTSLHPGGVVEYLTCFEVERVEPEVFRHLCEEMIADSSRHRLLHRFGSSNRLAPPPLSHVCIEARVKGLSVQSFHTFPDEHAIVRSQSLYELIAPAPRR
jgi:hypothetical protein